jgi:predicted GNAT family acetyltransferase
MQFSGSIYKLGINPVVEVPARISAAFGRRGFVPVRVTLGRRTFPANLVPVGGGRHRLYLNLPMRRAAGKESGERLTVRLRADPTSRVLPTPADLARALGAAGRRALAAIPPSRRKEIIRWLTAAKMPATRARRIAKIMAHFPAAPYRKLSPPMSDPVTVQHDAAAHCYAAVVDGHRSVCDYEIADGKMVFTHTFVPPELRGRGIAEKLVRTALTEARQAGRKVVPACSYVAVFIQRNQEFADLLPD